MTANMAAPTKWNLFVYCILFFVFCTFSCASEPHKAWNRLLKNTKSSSNDWKWLTKRQFELRENHVNSHTPLLALSGTVMARTTPLPPATVTVGTATKASDSDKVEVSASETATKKLQIPHRNIVAMKSTVAKQNLRSSMAKSGNKNGNCVLCDSVKPSYSPGQTTPTFVLPTLRGALKYPGDVINQTTPIIFHSFNPHSGFLACLWNCSDSLNSDFFKDSQGNTHYIFMSNSRNAYNDIHWMKLRILQVAPPNSTWSMIQRLHFVTLPLYQLGNWIPDLVWQWSCPDHNCGFNQVLIESADTLKHPRPPLDLKRLDARYDWLPSPSSTFGDKPMNISRISDVTKACSPNITIPRGVVAIVAEGGCSYFEKVHNLQRAGAVAVLVEQTVSTVLQDMNCVGAECSTQLSIPAAMISYSQDLASFENATVRFQNTPSENFFFAVDHKGRLAELGWFLYPSFQFFTWQAQWFTYESALEQRLSKEFDVLEVPVFNQTLMHGKDGAQATVNLPDLKILRQYQKFELDTSLSCPDGVLDQDCPHWDHTVQLYVCCNLTSPLCGMELGRWISPFRRGIGRWLTPVHSLLPLLTDTRCTFTMKSVPWAMAWSPSLTLRFSDKFSGTGHALYPAKIKPLYLPQFTFDKQYNQHFPQVSFTVSQDTEKLVLTSIITGHGSDENGCGEFCVTSHHFVFNDHSFNKTFDTAGSPFGCADKVLQGVEPNEHGTWLYGRDGWCDGQQVSPWVADLTAEIKVKAANTISYYGWFNGMDPDPKQNPGIMIFYSYLTEYEEWSFN